MTQKQIKLAHVQAAGHCRYPEVFVDLVWNHSQIVKEIALELVTNLQSRTVIKADHQLIVIGSLIHDIGAYQCFDEDFNPDKKNPSYFYHGWVGERILKNLSFPADITRFTITHTSTGITKEDIKRENLNLDFQDYVPITIEEEIVNYADKFHTKSPEFVTYDQAVTKLVRFDESRRSKMEILRKKYGVPALSPLIKKYSPWQKRIEEFFSGINQKP